MGVQAIWTTLECPSGPNGHVDIDLNSVQMITMVNQAYGQFVSLFGQCLLPFNGWMEDG